MTKYFLVLICFSFLVSCDQDDPRLGTWKQLNDFPFEGRGYAHSFSLLGKGYLMSGETVEHQFKDVWCYDPAADLWTRKNDYPYSFSVACVVTTRDKAYVLDYTGTLYEYNPVTDSWKYLSTFPSGPRPSITGFGLGGNVYFGTGLSMTPGEGYYHDFWKYDVSQNEWTQIGNLPGVGRSNAFSFVIGDHAYVGLGSSGDAPPIYPDVYRYNAKTGQWKQIAHFPEINLLMGNSFSTDSKGYIGLSEWNHAEMFEYDPVANSWRRMRTFPSEFSSSNNSFTIDNRMFVFGGWSAKSGSYNSQHMWEFLP